MGEFTICSDNHNNSTLISNQFIDVYMKEANEAQIKTYLYLVRMMYAGRSTSISEMADAFNHTEKEIVRSLKYWEKMGLIRLEMDEEGVLCAVHLCNLQNNHTAKENLLADESSLFAASSTPSRSSALSQAKSVTEGAGAPRKISSASGDLSVDIPSITIRRPAGSTAPSANRLLQSERTIVRKSDPQRTELFFIVEQYIGKPLSAIEMQKINYIADDLHFSDDLIDFLVQYCVGNGKKDFRYIEKVAVNWAEEGISTTSQARENVARGPVKAARAATAAAGSAAAANTKKNKKAASSNSFNQFQQNSYNFEELEKQLLNS